MGAFVVDVVTGFDVLLVAVSTLVGEEAVLSFLSGKFEDAVASVVDVWGCELVAEVLEVPLPVELIPEVEAVAGDVEVCVSVDDDSPVEAEVPTAVVLALVAEVSVVVDVPAALSEVVELAAVAEVLAALLDEAVAGPPEEVGVVTAAEVSTALLDVAGTAGEEEVSTTPLDVVGTTVEEEVFTTLLDVAGAATVVLSPTLLDVLGATTVLELSTALLDVAAGIAAVLDVSTTLLDVSGAALETTLDPPCAALVVATMGITDNCSTEVVAGIWL